MCANVKSFGKVIAKAKWCNYLGGHSVVYLERLFCSSSLFGRGKFLRIGKIVDSNGKKHIQQRV